MELMHLLVRDNLFCFIGRDKKFGSGINHPLVMLIVSEEADGDLWNRGYRLLK